MDSVTYFITGASGMLGSDVQTVLADRDVRALSRAALDITDLDAVRAGIAGASHVINCAAYTAVDAAEADEDAAFAINALGAQNLAIATAEIGASLVQISTDYVFDGSATSPYAENAPREPISAYGRTKAEGERMVLAANPERGYVLRTAWIYGQHGGNFAKTMVRLAGNNPTLTVVDDQRGQPTSTVDLAERIVALLDADAPAGVYHGTNSGETTWFGFARAVFEKVGLDPERIQPTDSTAFVRPAPRPAYSVLGHDAWAAAGLAPMRDWREALATADLAAVTP
ncbi:dTDP-4-dehydrorhamnose reductase [Microbacteriaceae bacterium VKM Ac-2855]|nr:dTDP-4-dehydrorhamnose reductase [Microbacteriaceae bacterium VKM Ac-2855]